MAQSISRPVVVFAMDRPCVSTHVCPMCAYLGAALGLPADGNRFSYRNLHHARRPVFSMGVSLFGVHSLGESDWCARDAVVSYKSDRSPGGVVQWRMSALRKVYDLIALL